MESSDSKLCRFCFSKPKMSIDIFVESNAHIVKVLDEHFGELDRLDALPGCICYICWSKIQDFHKFHRRVRSAQAEYLKKVVKIEVEDENPLVEAIEQPNFVEVLTNTEDFHEFTGQFITKTETFHEIDETEIRPELTYALCNDVEPPETLDSYQNEDDELKDSQEESEEKSENESESDPINLNSAKISAVKKKEIFVQYFDNTCDLCSTELNSLRQALPHYKRQHKIDEGYVKCCQLKFKSEKLVNDHIQFHINPEIFKCKYCGKCMKTRLSLAVHETNHRNSKVYTCDICNSTYTKLDKLKRHMVVHISKNVECHLCKKRCASKVQLREHLRFYHQSEDEVQKHLDVVRKMKKTLLTAAEVERIQSTQFDMKCEKCDCIFKSLQEAQYHYMKEHQIPDGYLQCCGVKMKKNTDIEGHALYHLKPEIFLCNICKRQSTSVISFRAHLRVHGTRQARNNVCEVCKKAFKEISHLSRHRAAVHGIESRKPEKNRKETQKEIQLDSNRIKEFFDMHCDVCKTELSSLQYAKLHYLNEHGIPGGYIKCCDLKFKELRDVDDHLQYHIDPFIFGCSRCEKYFPRKSDLSAHMSQHKAVDTKKYICDECGKIWSTKYQLNLHKRSHEMKGEKTFPCQYCNRKFSTKKLQKAHTLRIHEKQKEEKTEICEYCAKSFTTRKEVLSHIRSIHTDSSIRKTRVQCEICDAWLSNRYTLKDHMTRHNSGPQKCPQCDKISPNQNALACHIREVHCDRTFSCHMCGKTFKAAAALKDHIATHTGEKLYKCSFCPEAFIWRPNCYAHQKKAHPEEWKKKKGEVRKRTCK